MHAAWGCLPVAEDVCRAQQTLPVDTHLQQKRSVCVETHGETHGTRGFIRESFISGRKCTFLQRTGLLCQVLTLTFRKTFCGGWQQSCASDRVAVAPQSDELQTSVPIPGYQTHQGRHLGRELKVCLSLCVLGSFEICCFPMTACNFIWFKPGQPQESPLHPPVFPNTYKAPRQPVSINSSCNGPRIPG